MASNLHHPVGVGLESHFSLSKLALSAEARLQIDLYVRQRTDGLKWMVYKYLRGELIQMRLKAEIMVQANRSPLTQPYTHELR